MFTIRADIVLLTRADKSHGETYQPTYCYPTFLSTLQTNDVKLLHTFASN